VIHLLSDSSGPIKFFVIVGLQAFKFELAAAYRYGDCIMKRRRRSTTGNGLVRVTTSFLKVAAGV
jgi:hypothetical protein